MLSKVQEFGQAVQRRVLLRWSAKTTGVALAALGAVSLSHAKEHAEQELSFDFEHVSCRGADNEIRLVITDVKKSVGLITIDLYANDEEGFLKTSGRVLKKKVAARSPMTSVCLPAPEATNYAIALYHDKDANGKLNKGAFGIPSEPWGMSTNPKLTFGPPPVEKVLFAVSQEGAKVHIDLNN